MLFHFISHPNSLCNEKLSELDYFMQALELKKLQSPLYQFYNSLNVSSPPSPFAIGNKENVPSNCNLPPKSKSPNRSGCRRFSTAFDVNYSSSAKSFSRRVSNIGDVHSQASKDVKELLLNSQGEPLTPRSAKIPFL